MKSLLTLAFSGLVSSAAGVQISSTHSLERDDTFDSHAYVTYVHGLSYMQYAITLTASLHETGSLKNHPHVYLVKEGSEEAQVAKKLTDMAVAQGWNVKVLTYKPIDIDFQTKFSFWDEAWQRVTLYRMGDRFGRVMHIDADAIAFENIEPLLVEGALPSAARRMGSCGLGMCSKSLVSNFMLISPNQTVWEKIEQFIHRPKNLTFWEKVENKLAHLDQIWGDIEKAIKRPNNISSGLGKPPIWESTNEMLEVTGPDETIQFEFLDDVKPMAPTDVSYFDCLLYQSDEKLASWGLNVANPPHLVHLGWAGKKLYKSVQAHGANARIGLGNVHKRFVQPVLDTLVKLLDSAAVKAMLKVVHDASLAHVSDLPSLLGIRSESAFELSDICD